jgi:hypothetical protein
MYAEAHTLGCEIGDPCWEALALRGLALVARRNQRTDQARDLLTEAVASCRRLADVYKWAEVVVLTELLELDPAARDVELARALGLAGPMPDLFERLQNRSRLQTRTQTGDRPAPTTHQHLAPTSPSPNDRLGLAAQLASARLATSRYATNLAAAKADGYQIITP